MDETTTVEAIVAEVARESAWQRSTRMWGSWVIEANIIRDLRRGRDGVTLHTGTPKFRGGAKVYVVGVYWGMANTAVVVGHHRIDQKYLGCAIPLRLLEKLRPKVLYSPGVARAIAYALDTAADRECFYATEKETIRAVSRIEGVM